MTKKKFLTMPYYYCTSDKLSNKSEIFSGLVDGAPNSVVWETGRGRASLAAIGCSQTCIHSTTYGDCNKNNVTSEYVDLFASDQAQWVEAFATVYGKMQANGYDRVNDLVEADYGCCTRNPPSMKSGTNFALGSGFQCEEAAFCTQADEEK